MLASDVKTFHLVLNWEDCDIIDSMTAALDPLGESTDVLSALKHITISAVLISCLTKEMLREADEDTLLTAQMNHIIKVLTSSYSVGWCCFRWLYKLVVLECLVLTWANNSHYDKLDR